MLSKNIKRVTWAMQIAVALILGQTLFFKFSGAAETVYIFETLGAEPWGRIGSGLVELLAVILILSPKRAVYGALLALGVMAGAIGSHLTLLGIEVQGDGGGLFGMAVLVFALSAAIAGVRREEIFALRRVATESPVGR
jgi:hypothetical protein